MRSSNTSVGDFMVPRQSPEAAELGSKTIRQPHGAAIHLAHLGREVAGHDTAALLIEPGGDRSSALEALLAHALAPIGGGAQIGLESAVAIFGEHDAVDLLGGLGRHEAVL